MIRFAYVFTTVYGHDTSLGVCVEGTGRGGWVRGVVVGVSCVYANVYVCIFHSHDHKKIFLASKDKNEVLKSFLLCFKLDLWVHHFCGSFSK